MSYNTQNPPELASFKQHAAVFSVNAWPISESTARRAGARRVRVTSPTGTTVSGAMTALWWGVMLGRLDDDDVADAIAARFSSEMAKRILQARAQNIRDCPEKPVSRRGENLANARLKRVASQ